MKVIVVAIALSCLTIVESRYHMSRHVEFDRQWTAEDARQNCTTKCADECEYCKDPKYCTEDQFKCGEKAPEVGPDCPPDDVCVPSGCECQLTGTDGELCPLICPVDCPDTEILCPGGTMPNTCKENDYCHPKGVDDNGNTCPGYCPEDCEEEEMRCSVPNDPVTGCDVAPLCVPEQKDDQGNICPQQQCPLTCNATQTLCHGSVDHIGCKEDDTCVTNGISETGEQCPGTCPVECTPDEVLCPGQVNYDNGPYLHCVGQDECKPRVKDMNGDPCPEESASHNCPVTCPPDEVLCLPGDGALGCKLPAECSPKTIDNNGTYCPEESDCPTICEDNEVNCPGGTAPNGCKNPDICVEQPRNIDGELCTVNCPIECEDNEILCPGGRDESGCLRADECVIRATKDRGSDIGGLCPGWCPPVCKHNEILCNSQIDPCDGCPTEEICVPAQTDVNGVYCSGKNYPDEPMSASHGCPRLCDDLQGYALCPVEEDDTGCKPEAECRLKDLDINNEWCPSHSVCPVQCKNDEILCHFGRDPRGCDYPDQCLPKGTDLDGNTCSRSCPMPCDESQQFFCNGGILANGCHEPDFCVDRTLDIDGELCPGVCPPSCQPGEVIQPALTTDARGCIKQATCVPAVEGTEYSITSEFTVDGINIENFEEFYDLLVQAVADALEVAASQVELSLEDPEETDIADRQDGLEYGLLDDGLRIYASVTAVGLEKEEEILMEMESATFEADVNVEIEKKPALKQAGARVKRVTKPIARMKRGGQCVVGFPELMCTESRCTIDSDCRRIAKKHSSSFGACVFKGELPRKCKGNDCIWLSECSSNIGGPSMSAPVVKVPNRDIFIPKPGSPIKTKPKQLGESCGSCNCPPTYTAGECEEGLDCVHNPMIADAPGKCINRAMCCRALNAKCKACEAGMTVEEFCSYPINAHVQGCGGVTCGRGICPFGSECCMTCDGEGQLIESGQCESTLNGNPGCPLVNCRPKGEQCGKTFCKPGTECCMGCDGPTGHCELSREAGGYGCPIPICLAPGEECGDVVCKRGGECCKKCGRDGELVPSGECRNPLEDGRGCPLIHCEVPITRGPPIIIDPPVYCCEALIAECEACKAQMPVEKYCIENPKMQGCEPIVGNECTKQECGTPCEGSLIEQGGGICDGKGSCVSPRINPCAQHGCDGKKCGEDCLMGDIMGWCDHRGTCDFSPVKCGNGICECGKPCKLDGGNEGVCQSDGVTCAQNIVPPKCRVVIFPIHGCEIVDLDGNCIEQCFGGFPISVSMDEDGNMEEVCGCSGDECNINPCDECKRKAEEKGMEEYTCPCPNL